MKKFLLGLLVVFAAFLMVGCASDDGAVGGAKYVLSEDDEVIAIYNFEEPVDEGDVPDASGNENLGYTGGDGTYVEGKYGQAMLFNGADGYIMLDEDLMDCEGMTVAAWIKPEGWKDWARVFDFGDGGSGDAWLGYAPVERMLRFDIFSGPNAVTITAPVPQPGKWTHVAATFGDGFARLYINGKMVTQLPIALKPCDLPRKGMFIGRSNWPDPLFMGAMDDVLVAGTVFDKKQIAALANGIVISDGEEPATDAR